MARETNRHGYFLKRTKESVYLHKHDKEEFKMLKIFPFSADRKAMSVLVQTPDNKKLLFVKGADSSML
jgi:magnesium-transporting ATPase (P-type)